MTALGYVLGGAYRWSVTSRQRLLSRLGVGLAAGFLVLRFANVYGDPFPWVWGKSSLWTVMSFLNTNKYPPSLLFLMMTLGPAILLLRPALIIGKVPLFFYIVHFYLIHALAVVASYVRFGTVREVFQSPDLGHFPFSAPPGWNPGLPMVYLVWMVVVLALVPMCYWYAGFRRRRNDWWLSYL